MTDKKKKNGLQLSVIVPTVLDVRWSCLGSREDPSDGVPGALAEPFWELDLILHQ